MNDINSVIVVGRLTKTPDGKDFGYTSGGTARLNVSIAVNESVKGINGYEQRASFFDVTVWGKQAEAVRPYLGKGKQIAVEGRLRQERWKDAGGYNRSRVGIVASSIQLLGSKNDGNSGDDGQTSSAPAQGNAPAQQSEWSGDMAEFPEDIPF